MPPTIETERMRTPDGLPTGLPTGLPGESPLPGEPPQRPTSEFKDRLKYRLVKAAKTTGLSFLTPIVLLCFWEEPSLQCREIGRALVVPILAFIAFLMLWTAIAPHHKTKSGEVPTPAVVWTAAKDIWSFHRRENSKEDAFLASGEDRDERLADAQERLKEIVRYTAAAARNVENVKVEQQTWLATRLTDIDESISRLSEESKQTRLHRGEQMAALARGLSKTNIEAKTEYLRLLRQDIELKESEDTTLRTLKQERDEILDEKYPQLAAALDLQSKIAEEKQYLNSVIDQYGRANRSTKLEAEIARLRANQENLLRASGDQVAVTARKVLQSEKRIESIANSSYAKPWTLPMQITRSVACAFVGFLMGTAIAIPAGVMCGLSPTFMAAMTPFIALFKPVSPIVWLPIALIVVSGFIPDPDTHWFTTVLAELPLIGWMRINPAFIASAITVAMCSLWATMVNTALGVSSVDKDHLNVARVLQLGFWNRLFNIVIPSALPLIFAGLRISLGVGWMVLIAGELLSSSEGIGKFVWDQFNNGATDSFAKMTVVVFVVGVIGLLLDRVMIVFERLVSFDEVHATL